MRDGLRMLLSGQAGFEVVAETGDAEAVALLVRRFLPQLVLLDMDLDAQGLEIVSAIKAGFDGAVKVLLLTGELQPGALRRALLADADGYAHKSEDGDALLRAVQAVLAGRQHVSRGIAAVFLPSSLRRDAAGEALAATPREREIMSLVAHGLSNREIAKLLAISVLTVRTHRQNLMEKFRLHNAAEITACAVRRGYYTPS
ncbi:response regulator containing a CheY-like receiver domain and an HTH DNA-binding domain [Polaromonas sp. CF318]|uniref:LuxR C-terminal-related transcriptional regulator n=1 Tax=Polaromonas sp. CF318 TaxID=1144318 RepID=UPI00027135BA|nr:response regulator transcription factor [Polaromonas sp. CF318]EJL81390.1 response regulator containing a CheY-like receiver domain and an HTH DNA-binding domain [Polaromonas sp. CF318]